MATGHLETVIGITKKQMVDSSPFNSQSNSLHSKYFISCYVHNLSIPILELDRN